MDIRGATKTDFDFIVSVIDKWWGGPSGDRALPVFFYELGRQALIAEEGGSVVGFLLGFTSENEPPVGYVHLVGIDPDFRRRGVGKRLYDEFIRRCASEGVRRFKAITPAGHEGSIAFHQALGFRVEEVPDYAGPGRVRVVFTKDL